MHRSKGAIAAGHPETAKAAELMLRDGGNAFDAVVAAQLTAFVAEPVLTSLGGGGFLLAETANGKQTLYDFFVQTPCQKREKDELNFYPISADFGEVRQQYHVGPGSIATPGMVKGLFSIHNDLCTFPLEKLAVPAIQLAKQGVNMSSFQSGLFDIIKPVYKSSDESRRIFKSTRHAEELVREGDVLKQPELANFLSELIDHGETLFYEGEVATLISHNCHYAGGHLTLQDLQNYRVVKRKPLKIPYRGHHISINPPPCSGGLLIGFALRLMESSVTKDLETGTALYIDLMAQLQSLTDKARIDAFVKNPGRDPAETLFDPGYLASYKTKISDRKQSFSGTTHISIADGEGNKAALTSSNGEGSGVMIPGTGVMLNNMLGEKDLNPAGFHSWQTNQRVTSMMAPGILKMKNGTSIVFGSGGSNRIRTAILQVLLNLMDFGMSPAEAVDAPRIHYEEGILNLEGGFDQGQTSGILQQYPDHKIWKDRNLYFGGVHVVSSGPAGFSGAADSRRGGVLVVCE